MPEKPPPPDPALIDEAPIELVSLGELPESDRTYLEIIVSLSTELDEAKAELESLQGRLTVDEVRAKLLEPYLKKIFLFVVLYCVVVLLLIIGDGFGGEIFSIPDTVLGFIAGSTAVSVIGLIGMVITGLFGGRK